MSLLPLEKPFKMPYIVRIWACKVPEYNFFTAICELR